MAFRCSGLSRRNQGDSGLHPPVRLESESTSAEICLFVYPLDEWERKSATLREQPITDSETRKWRRVLAAFASETTCDKQGRIKIPQNLIEWARLEKEALITGALDRVEIWNPDIFARYMGDIEDKFEELAEGLLF